MNMTIRWALALVLAVAAGAQAEVVVYVSPGATPGGDGSRAKPCQTLEQARDTVQTLR